MPVPHHLARLLVSQAVELSNCDAEPRSRQIGEFGHFGQFGRFRQQKTVDLTDAAKIPAW